MGRGEGDGCSRAHRGRRRVRGAKQVQVQVQVRSATVVVRMCVSLCTCACASALLARPSPLLSPSPHFTLTPTLRPHVRTSTQAQQLDAVAAQMVQMRRELEELRVQQQREAAALAVRQQLAAEAAVREAAEIAQKKEEVERRLGEVSTVRSALEEEVKRFQREAEGLQAKVRGVGGWRKG